MQVSYGRTDYQIPRTERQQRWIRMLPSLIIGLIALVVIGAVFDTVFDRIIGPRVDSYRSELAKLHHVQIVLSDTEEGLLDYAMSGKLAPLERFVSGKNVIATEIEPFLPQLDKLTSTRSGANGASVLASHENLSAEGWADQPVQSPFPGRDAGAYLRGRRAA